jgi:hypothetical protein
MSASETTPTPVDGHQCDSPVQLVVSTDGGPVGIPIIGDGCRLYERKQGPTSITRRAEVSIPIEYDGRVWTDEITAFEPEGAVQQAEVRYAPIDTDGNPIGQPRPIFRGYVGAIGSVSGPNRARVSIFDPMKFLSVVSAGVTFGGTVTTVGDVLRYVRERFLDEVPIFDGLTLVDGGVETDVARAFISIVGNLDAGLSTPVPNPATSFSSNRDTLADVIRWLRDTTGVHVEFRPVPSGGGLALVVTDGHPSAHVDLTPESGEPPYVFANSSLAEMRPFNALRLKGATGTDVGDFRVPTLIDNDYPEVVATYPPLVDRFGERLTETETSSTAGVDNLEREAKSRLKKRLDEVSGGTILTTLAPQLHPYDTVLATPACSGVAADVDPIRYEVERTVHKVTPDPSDDGVTPLPRTELAVSLAVDESLIEVAESTVKTTQPSRGGDNEPDDSPISGLTWSIGAE